MHSYKFWQWFTFLTTYYLINVLTVLQSHSTTGWLHTQLVQWNCNKRNPNQTKNTYPGGLKGRKITPKVVVYITPTYKMNKSALWDYSRSTAVCVLRMLTLSIFNRYNTQLQHVGIQHIPWVTILHCFQPWQNSVSRPITCWGLQLPVNYTDLASTNSWLWRGPDIEAWKESAPINAHLMTNVKHSLTSSTGQKLHPP